MSGWTASTIELSYPRSRRWFALAGALLFLGIAVAAIVDTTADRILIPIGLAFGVGCLWSAVTSGGSATADASGIVSIGRNGARRELAWHDLASISIESNAMRLRSTRGEEITVSPGLNNYVAFLHAVVAMDRPANESRTVFASNRSRIAIVGVGLVFAALGVATSATGMSTAGTPRILWVLAVGALIAAVFQPSRQELTDDAIVIRSLLTRKRVRRETIADVGFIQTRGRYGPSYPRLALTLAGGRRVILDCSDMLEVYDNVVRWLRGAASAQPLLTPGTRSGGN